MPIESKMKKRASSTLPLTTTDTPVSSLSLSVGPIPSPSPSSSPSPKPRSTRDAAFLSVSLLSVFFFGSYLFDVATTVRSLSSVTLPSTTSIVTTSAVVLPESDAMSDSVTTTRTTTTPVSDSSGVDSVITEYETDIKQDDSSSSDLPDESNNWELKEDESSESAETEGTTAPSGETTVLVSEADDTDLPSGSESVQEKLLESKTELELELESAIALEPETTPESAGDAEPETPPGSVANDAGSETVLESAAEPEPETDPESAADEQPETAPEFKANKEPETTPESTTDKEPKSAPESAAEPDPETAPESAADEQPETTPESTADEQPETTPESTAEQEPETTPESTADAEPESTTDKELEPIPESTSDEEPETTPESTTDKEPESASESAAEPDPETAPESTGDMNAGTMPDSAAEPEPETTPESTADKEPESTPESAADATSAGDEELETAPESTNDKEPETQENLVPESTGDEEPEIEVELVPDEVNDKSNSLVSIIPSNNTSTEMLKEDLEEWWAQYVEAASRAYPMWPVDGDNSEGNLPTETNYSDPSRYSWCHQRYSNPSMLNGLIYIKSHKASSSTCSGVARSIAHNVGRRMFGKTSVIDEALGTTEELDIPCNHYAFHSTGDNNRHASRNATHSLLWSFVRNPAARDLSEVYYFKVAKGLEPTDENIMSKLLKLRGKQSRYLSPKAEREDHSWPGYKPTDQPDRFVSQIKEEIFDNYEFIGITERMDESLAVMTLLWHLPPSDVIVLSSRRSGGFDTGVDRGQCVKLPKAQRTPAIEEFFATQHKVNNTDIFLYQTAVRSLEKTIDALGRDRVEERAAEIRKLQEIANTHCQSEAVYPCSEEGVLQVEESKKNCYASDTGCAHACIDRVLEEYRLGKLES